MNRKINFMLFLTLFVILCQVDFNLARPNSARGNHRSSSYKSKDISGKRSVWSEPLDSGPGDETFMDLPNSDLLADLEEAIPDLAVAKTTNENSGKPHPPRKWLQLEDVLPITVRAKANTDLTLECTAVGSPPPTVYWLKNGKPIDVVTHSDFEYSSNYVLGRSVYRNPMENGFSMAKVNAKIPFQCLRPEDEGEYTCVADNQGRQMITSTIFTIDEADRAAERRPECEARSSTFSYNKKGKKGHAAFIMSFESLHMETIGNDIMLTCHGAGKPRPAISWTDSQGHKIVNGKKFQVTQSGNLVIRSLSWNEMGEYTCTAANSLGSDTAATFLYPLSPEEKR